MRCRVASILLLVVVCYTACAVGEDPPPSVMAGILTRDGIGARALALGAAFAAIADDSTAGYYNPAGLPNVPGAHVGAMYESKFDLASGTSFQYLSGTYLLERVGLGTGLTLVRRSDQDIPMAGGTFDTSESLLLLSTGYELAELLSLGRLAGLSVGASAKFYSHRGYAEARASGIGLDLGVLARIDFDGLRARIGFRSSDVLGSTIQWRGTLNEIAEVVPWGQHIGIAVSLPDIGLGAVLEAALYAGDSAPNSIHLGAEYTLFGFALRAGLNNGTPVLGLGATPLEWLAIDFAIALHRGLGQSIIASTEFFF